MLGFHLVKPWHEMIQKEIGLATWQVQDNHQFKYDKDTSWKCFVIVFAAFVRTFNMERKDVSMAEMHYMWLKPWPYNTGIAYMGFNIVSVES